MIEEGIFSHRLRNRAAAIRKRQRDEIQRSEDVPYPKSLSRRLRVWGPSTPSNTLDAG